MPPTKTKKSINTRPKAVRYELALGETPKEFDYLEHPYYLVISTFVKNQNDKNKYPTEAEIRRHIPFAMGQLQRQQERTGYLPTPDSFYVKEMSKLFQCQPRLPAIIKELIEMKLIRERRA
jgi:hypothetical protein